MLSQNEVSKYNNNNREKNTIVFVVVVVLPGFKKTHTQILNSN